MPTTQAATFKDRDLASTFLLAILAVICGLIAAFLGLTFELKIVIGLLSGLLFGTIILLRPFVGIVFLIVATPIFTVFPATFFGSGVLNPQNLVTIWVALALFLQRGIVLRVGPSPWSMFVPALMFFGAILMSLLLQIANGYGDLGGLANYARTYLFGFVIFYLAANAIQSEKHARRVIWTVLIMVVLTSMWGLVEYRSAVASGQSVDRIRVSGRVGQPNEFGAFLAMYIPFLIAALRAGRSIPFQKLFLLGGVVAAFFALLFTQSRGAYLGILLFGVFSAVLINRKLLIVIAVLVLTGPIWLPAQVVDRVTNTFTEQEEGLDRSSESRLMFWEAGWNMFKESPIYGHGFRSFNELVYQRGVADQKRSSHSLYIQLMAEAGLIGIGSLLFLFYSLSRIAWRLRQESDDPFVRAFAEGYIGCMVSVAVVNIFGVRFYNYGTVSYFWACTAVLLRYRYLHERSVKARLHATFLAEREVKPLLALPPERVS
jgi:O-antigen ligase